MRAGSVLGRVQVIGSSCNCSQWGVWPFIGVGIDAVRYKAVVLSNQCLWVLNGSGAIDSAMWPFCCGVWVWMDCGLVYSWSGSGCQGGSLS